MLDKEYFCATEDSLIPAFPVYHYVALVMTD